MAKKKLEAPHPFGKILIEARKKKGISRYALSLMVNKRDSNLYMLEKGKNEPTIRTLIELAEALKIDPCEMFRDLYMALKNPDALTESDADDGDIQKKSNQRAAQETAETTSGSTSSVDKKRFKLTRNSPDARFKITIRKRQNRIAARAASQRKK